MDVLDRLRDEARNCILGLVGLEYIPSVTAAILPGITHLHMGLGGGSEMFVPARCFGDGSGGCMLLVGQVPLLFDLEHLRVVVMHGAGAFRYASPSC